MDIISDDIIIIVLFEIRNNLFYISILILMLYDIY